MRVSFLVFVGVVVAANWLTNQFGMVTVFGLTATAGTWLAGFGFVARDALHEKAGRRWVLAAIAVGAVLSAVLSPRLAVASAAAFAVSELADWAVYSPLRRRGRVAAAIASNAVGAVVDTLLFLALAGFPLSGTLTQVVIKVGVTTLFVAGVSVAVSRKPLHSAGGEGHA